MPLILLRTALNFKRLPAYIDYANYGVGLIATPQLLIAGSKLVPTTQLVSGV
jgi:hypothetical protein